MRTFIIRLIGALIVLAMIWAMSFVAGIAVGAIASIFMTVPLVGNAVLYATYSASATALLLIIGEVTGSIEWNN